MPRTIRTESRVGFSGLTSSAPISFMKIRDAPKPSRKRSSPAASAITRASIATVIGWRVNGEMIPQPIVSRSVSCAISGEIAVAERHSIACLRHHG